MRRIRPVAAAARGLLLLWACVAGGAGLQAGAASTPYLCCISIPVIFQVPLSRALAPRPTLRPATPPQVAKAKTASAKKATTAKKSTAKKAAAKKA